MQEIFTLITSMAPYLLLGFLLAGIMHAFVPATLYHRFLGGASFRSVFNATLLGIPLPLCSCGVIPTAMSLRKEGASKGATTSFLIATPQTGIDSIIATYSLMGLPFALLRPIVALQTALIGGCLVNAFEQDECEAQKPEAQGSTKETETSKTFVQRLKVALHYAFVEMMQDIGKWLVIGLMVAGVITVFVPDSFFAYFSNQPLLSMLLVLACAIPMYLCATGSIPIAVALMLKGLSPGTALVLLMAGPAVNVASLLVISKVMGRKTLMLYLLSIIGGAMGFGLCVDYLFTRSWFTASLTEIHACSACGTSTFNLISFILLALLLCNALVRRYFSHGKCTCNNSCSCHSESITCACKTAELVIMKIEIRGLKCNHCKANAEKAILGLNGVKEVYIELATGKTQITGGSNLDEVKKAVEALGFEIVSSEC
jgi:uncharacterized membrane protein YraQ (UPF0718 family)/copper chaperone CopZ